MRTYDVYKIITHWVLSVHGYVHIFIIQIIHEFKGISLLPIITPMTVPWSMERWLTEPWSTEHQLAWMVKESAIMTPIVHKIWGALRLIDSFLHPLDIHLKVLKILYLLWIESLDFATLHRPRVGYSSKAIKNSTKEFNDDKNQKDL